MSELPSACWLVDREGRVRESDSAARRLAPEHAATGALFTSAFGSDDVAAVSAALGRASRGERVALDVTLGLGHEAVVLILEPEPGGDDGRGRGLRALVVGLAASGALAPGEVEVIAHGVSHDLGSHLRSLASFATFLAEDAGPALPAAAREDLARTHGAISRLRAGLDGLVRYLRGPEVGRGVGSAREAVLEATGASELEPGARKSTVEVSGVEVDAEDSWVPLATPAMVGVVRALVENAREQGAKRVRVGLSREGDRARITVEDDGEGLAPEERSRARLPFTRLRPRVAGEVHPGLGLATVERVVRSVGGRVALAVSSLGGLEVRVDLPRVRPL